MANRPLKAQVLATAKRMFKVKAKVKWGRVRSKAKLQFKLKATSKIKLRFERGVPARGSWLA